MKKNQPSLASTVTISALTVLWTATAVLGAEIETTGTPGSPGATTTITGKQLPAPDPKFDGEIK
jgi:arylsulfatase